GFSSPQTLSKIVNEGMPLKTIARRQPAATVVNDQRRNRESFENAAPLLSHFRVEGDSGYLGQTAMPFAGLVEKSPKEVFVPSGAIRTTEGPLPLKSDAYKFPAASNERNPRLPRLLATVPSDVPSEAY